MALDAPRHAFLNRVDRRFTTDDINIPPRRFYFRRVDRRLEVGDIDGARVGDRHRPRWPRCVDPLDPVYKLASFVHEPPEPIRFTRDTLDISDIEGTRTTVPMVLRMKTRDHISYDDVPGSVAAHYQARRAARPVRPVMMVADINDSGRFRSRRHTDPLSPRYVMNGADASGLSSMRAEGGVVIGDIPGSHPKAIRAKPVPTFTLATRDIDGNEPMWRVHRQQRMAVRLTNVTDDIEGAQADTAGRWQWARRTNPLMPEYQALDRGDPPLNPLAATNIGVDLHEHYLEAERLRLRSSGGDSCSNDADSDTESKCSDAGETEHVARSSANHRSTPAVPMRSATSKMATNSASFVSISSQAWRKSSAPPTSNSSRSQASSKKAPSLRELRERQEKAHDQALVKALPAL